MENGYHEIPQKDEQILNMIFNPNMPNVATENTVINSESNENEQFDATLLERVKRIEIDGVKHAENEDLEKALACFNEAIDLLPGYAAAYNNRAQAKRMLNDKEGAYADLEHAIRLSEGQTHTAALAFTQRGLLRKLDGDCDGSLEDFKAAAKLGNMFAKQQVVEANPYAAMCNKMLNEVIEKLRSGEQV